jgi:uncharacterized protein (DUF302 family)
MVKGGNYHVNEAVAFQTYVVAERFEKALKLIRRALSEMDIEIVGEYDNIGALTDGSSRREKASKILLVNCPMLNFEALALDRAAAVFFPLHVLVSATGDWTQVSIINLARLSDARLPVGAEAPIRRLAGRIELALESVSQEPGNQSR